MPRTRTQAAATQKSTLEVPVAGPKSRSRRARKEPIAIGYDPAVCDEKALPPVVPKTKRVRVRVKIVGPSKESQELQSSLQQ